MIVFQDVEKVTGETKYFCRFFCVYHNYFDILAALYSHYNDTINPEDFRLCLYTVTNRKIALKVLN